MVELVAHRCALVGGLVGGEIVVGLLGPGCLGGGVVVLVGVEEDADEVADGVALWAGECGGFGA